MPEADSHTAAGDIAPDTARKIVQALMTSAAGDAPEWSAAGLARGWVASIHGIEGHDEIAPGDPLADALYDAQHTKLNLLGQTSSRNAADIAAKLAVVVLETASDASGGDIAAALHRITASALADLVLMGERVPGPVAEAPAPEVAVPAEASAPAGASQHRPNETLSVACAAFDALEREGLQLFPGEKNAIEDEDAREIALLALQERQREFADVICATPATTWVELAAKARSLLMFTGGSMEPVPEADKEGWTIDHRLTASIMRDLSAGAKVAS
jgi:hypothetical protein